MSQEALKTVFRLDERTFDGLLELQDRIGESAHGFTVEMANDVVVMMIDMDTIDPAMVVPMIAAVGQTKENLKDNNLVLKVSEILGVETNDKGTKQTSVNFSAIRLMGQIWAAILDDKIETVKDLNMKTGNPFTRNRIPDGKAGEINRETQKLIPVGYVLPTVPEEKFKRLTTTLKIFFDGASKTIGTEEKAKIKERMAKFSEERKKAA